MRPRATRQTSREVYLVCAGLGHGTGMAGSIEGSGKFMGDVQSGPGESNGGGKGKAARPAASARTDVPGAGTSRRARKRRREREQGRGGN